MCHLEHGQVDVLEAHRAQRVEVVLVAAELAERPVEQHRAEHAAHDVAHHAGLAGLTSESGQRQGRA